MKVVLKSRADGAGMAIFALRDARRPDGQFESFPPIPGNKQKNEVSRYTQDLIFGAPEHFRIRTVSNGFDRNAAIFLPYLALISACSPTVVIGA